MAFTVSRHYILFYSDGQTLEHERGHALQDVENLELAGQALLPFEDTRFESKQQCEGILDEAYRKSIKAYKPHRKQPRIDGGWFWYLLNHFL